MPIVHTRAHRLLVLALEVSALTKPMREARLREIAAGSPEDARDVQTVANTIRAHQQRKD